MISHVFVYGTLMPGGRRWPTLAQWADHTVPDSVTGQLFDTGHGWPAAVIGSTGMISGFTIELAPDSLEVALAELDRIEGDGVMFTRTATVTARQVEAWVYDWTLSTDDFTPLDCWEAEMEEVDEFGASEGATELIAYIDARAELLGKEGDLDVLWKVVVAADHMQERAEQLLSLVQVLASLGDGEVLVAADDEEEGFVTGQVQVASISAAAIQALATTQE